jgi:hypothetical protein
VPPETRIRHHLLRQDGLVTHTRARALQRHVPFDPAYRAYCRNIGARGSAASAPCSSAPPTAPTPPQNAS